MNITSPTFVLFFTAAATIYYLLPRRFHIAWLMIISYAFYVSWAWEFAVILVILSLINFSIGRKVKARPAWVAIGITANLLALAGLKYADFFVTRFAVNDSLAEVILRLAVPVGISFLILQAVSYLIDVYRGQTEAEEDLLAFCLYLAYFPKLLSGPIERARTFLPQLRRSDLLITNDTFARAFTLILLGFLRKKAFADPLRTMVNPAVWETPGDFSSLQLLIGLLAFSFSLYNDFAGYTSIVRGVSLLFGIELSQNFKQPYFSRNFTEFWNRWHISLSNWLRDYVYFPVARVLRQRRAGSLLNLIVPPMVTMLISGLWHGATWSMLFWGGLHGLYLIIERLPTFWRGAVPPDQQPRWRQGVGMLATFGLTTLAWLPFLMPLNVAWGYLTRMVTGWGAGMLDGRVIVLILFTLGLDWLQWRGKDDLVFLGWSLPFRAAALTVALLILMFVLQSDSGASFVYQGF